MNEIKNLQLDNILHQRVTDNCLELFGEGHFKHAALESMKQVELSLKDKGLISNKITGSTLVRKVLGGGIKPRLIIPFGEDLQESALLLFRGAFSYYRNYAAHDGVEIDKNNCLRIMILASELLDLIGASNISLEGLGGINGLIHSGIYENEEQIVNILCFLNEKSIIAGDPGEFWLEVLREGYKEEQIELLLDLGIVSYDEDKAEYDIGQFTDIGTFTITDIGNKLLNK